MHRKSKLHLLLRRTRRVIKSITSHIQIDQSHIVPGIDSNISKWHGVSKSSVWTSNIRAKKCGGRGCQKFYLKDINASQRIIFNHTMYHIHVQECFYRQSCSQANSPPPRNHTSSLHLNGMSIMVTWLENMFVSDM